MTISKKLIKYLEDNKYKYVLHEHRVTYTAIDAAATQKIKPQQVAKTLAIKADNEYLLALIPSNRNLDKQKLLKVINAWRKKQKEKCYKKIDFAKEAWMKKNLLGKVGATPAFGKFLGMNIFADSLLLKNPKIYLGSGEYTVSIVVNTKQYLKIEEPMKGSFSKVKK